MHLPRDAAELAQAVQEAFGRLRHLVQGELPPVARSGQELLEDAERRVDLPALDRVPAGERGDVGEAALGQEAQELQLRVDAGLHAAERLEDQRLAEHHGGVGLLHPHGPHVDRASQAGLRGLGPAELQDGLVGRHLRARAHAVQQLPAARRVGQGVVDRPAARRGDDPLGPPLGLRPQADRHLVGLVRPLSEEGLHEGEHEHGRVVAQRERLDDLDVRHLAALGAEPALADDPLLQDRRVKDVEWVSHRLPP